MAPRSLLHATNVTAPAVPGYDIKDRKLIVNEREADLVRSIFTRFARGIPPSQLIETLAKEGALNKQGKPIEKGYLYRILNNQVYLGEAVHKGTTHPGEHNPIIDRNLWDQVHALIDRNSSARATRPLGRTPAVLKGLIFGPTGAAMTPAHRRPRRRGNRPTHRAARVAPPRSGRRSRTRQSRWTRAAPSGAPRSSRQAVLDRSRRHSCDQDQTRLTARSNDQ